MVDQKHVTRLLQAVDQGDNQALDELFGMVYDELHRRAQAQRNRWGGTPTMNTTALVHEAYVKLVDQDSLHWQNRAHFFAVAATAMRHILINYAKRKQAQKRGGDKEKVPADEVALVDEDAIEDLLMMNQALEQLEKIDERMCRVVECRFFLGLPINETADALGVSPSTVERDWRKAKAWLYKVLGDDK